MEQSSERKKGEIKFSEASNTRWAVLRHEMRISRKFNYNFSSIKRVEQEWNVLELFESSAFMIFLEFDEISVWSGFKFTIIMSNKYQNL